MHLNFMLVISFPETHLCLSGFAYTMTTDENDRRGLHPSVSHMLGQHGNTDRKAAYAA